MSDYLKQLEIELKDFDFTIDFKQKISKTEKKFLRILLAEYSEHQNEFVEISKSKVNGVLNFSSDNDIINFLDRFKKKDVSYSLKKGYKSVGIGSFDILSSYFIQDKSVICMLSKEILLSFSKDNFFHKINLSSILNFENSNSVSLYLKLLEMQQAEGEIEFSMEDIKTLFSSDNLYKRYYDFEKKILKPVVDDLNSYSEFEVSYSKLKTGEARSSRIIGVRFDFENKFIWEKKEQANALLEKVRNEVKNFELVYKILFKNLMIHDYNYTYNNLIFSKNNYKKNFDDFLIKALNENLCGIISHEKEKNKISVEKKVGSLYELHEEVNKLLYAFYNNSTDFLIKFYKDLHRLKDGENLEFKNNYLKIQVLYKKNDKSKIEIIEF